MRGRHRKSEEEWRGERIMEEGGKEGRKSRSCHLSVHFPFSREGGRGRASRTDIVTDSLRRSAERLVRGCEKFLPALAFLPGPAWLLLNKICTPFSRSLYLPLQHEYLPFAAACNCLPPPRSFNLQFYTLVYSLQVHFSDFST